MQTRKELLMGNQAIAYGAARAGVRFAAGYPGTPSSEILEYLAALKNEKIYTEWSTNEKSALEAAAGASYSGARTLVTMKQVGLNVASDPLMSLVYVGIKGGMVIAVADDPGPISSQTEQDTRHFGIFAKIPVFDPSSPQEAYEIIEYAYEVSEKYQTPVILRPTTRVCHACETVKIFPDIEIPEPEGFIKDTSRWVIFPKLAYENHKKIENNLKIISNEFSESSYNKIIGKTGTRRGIAASGAAYSYAAEVLADYDVKTLKITTPHPFPQKLALEFFKDLDELLVLEELDPVIERELLIAAGQHGIKIKIKGKLSGDAPNAGEYSVETVKNCLNAFTGKQDITIPAAETPKLPVRPPVLCAGCPHRASFYAVKRACKGKKAVFCGDIGCYTLGNAMPLDMVDTCLCMGAGITIAQGIKRIEPDIHNFAFIGDSTFFASGIAGIINAVYNKTDIIIVVLDNSTTAMTGQQPHPGTGKNISGEISQSVSIEAVLEGIGVKWIRTLNPFDQKAAVAAVEEACGAEGVRAVVFRAPCIALFKSAKKLKVNDKCSGCKNCIKQLGCPAIDFTDGKAIISASLCNGCGLCANFCAFGAFEEVSV